MSSSTTSVISSISSISCSHVTYNIQPSTMSYSCPRKSFQMDNVHSSSVLSSSFSPSNALSLHLASSVSLLSLFSAFQQLGMSLHFKPFPVSLFSLLCQFLAFSISYFSTLIVSLESFSGGQRFCSKENFWWLLKHYHGNENCDNPAPIGNITSKMVS